MISRQLARQLPGSGLRTIYSSTKVCQSGKGGGPSGPTNDSRTSPSTASKPDHPGYTPANTPITGAHPNTMPGPSPTAKVASETPQASTRPHAPHSGVEEMAKGAEIGGQDAISPEERNVKGWATNQRSAQFNRKEGKRNPVLHGGSNEGGHDSKGKSKT